jgi:nitrogen-specific signal transduction histidine kinase
VSRLARWIMRALFLDEKPPTQSDAVPASIRAASHEQANAASALRGAAMRLKRDATALEKLAESIQEEGD